MSNSDNWKKAVARFWDTIPENERQLFRLKVLQNCNVSSTTFYRWRTGLTLPAAIYRKKLNYIVRTMGYCNLYQPQKTEL